MLPASVRPRARTWRPPLAHSSSSLFSFPSSPATLLTLCGPSHANLLPLAHSHSHNPAEHRGHCCMHLSSNTLLACSCLGRAGTAPLASPKMFLGGGSIAPVSAQSKGPFPGELASCTALSHSVNLYGICGLHLLEETQRRQECCCTQADGVAQGPHCVGTAGQPCLPSPCICASLELNIHVPMRVAVPRTNCYMLQPWGCLHTPKGTRSLLSPSGLPSGATCPSPVPGRALQPLTCPAADVGCRCLVRSSGGSCLQGVLTSRGQAHEGVVVSAPPERGCGHHGAQLCVVQGQPVPILRPGCGCPGGAQLVRVPLAQPAHASGRQGAWGGSRSHCQDPPLGWGKGNASCLCQVCAAGHESALQGAKGWLCP